MKQQFTNYYLNNSLNKTARFFSIFLLLFSLHTLPLQARGANNDFEVKAFHVDLRCQVMTMDALKRLADRLAVNGVNTIIMEWEGAFPYDKHATLSNKYAYSQSEVTLFIKYCAALSIDVIPLQNCFGHVEYILRHDRYSRIKEDRKEISQVCPMQKALSKKIFTEIFTEMAAMHPSKYFHIGGDETYLLGSCKRCAAKVEADGKSQLFVDYVKIMCDIVQSLGKTPVLWADIILKYPEAASYLPKDAIFIDWNYGWRKDKFGDTENLLKHGFQFWGAPSLRSAPDNMHITQWSKHFDNISTFIPDARKAGYKGIVMTSWSTSGTYGFSYDAGHEVITMYPIRWVYPLAGFNILIDAYGKALNDHSSLDPHQFIVDYGQKEFGLPPSDSENLYNILYSIQNVVTRGQDTKKKSVLTLKEEAIEVQKQLNDMRPKSNKKDFAHLRLMFDFRLQYLTFKEIEARYQSDSFELSQVGSMMKELMALKSVSSKNDKQFLSLNKNYLNKNELIEMTRVRNEKLNNLYDVMRNLTNTTK